MGIFGRTKQDDVKEKAGAKPTVAAPAAVAVPKEGKRDGAYDVLVRPVVSEKAARLGAMNQYVFSVQPNATKHRIRDAVEAMYGVRPIRVAVTTMRGHAVRYGRTQGTTKHWKKAIVTLPKGKTIQVYEGV